MKLDFLDEIVEFAKRPEVSLIFKMSVKILIILSSFFPAPAAGIMRLVLSFFDEFDSKAAQGIEVSLADKRAATEYIVNDTLARYHGSGSLLSESWVRQTIAAFVHILGIMRYGENAERSKLAAEKGYMASMDDLKEVAAKIGAALPLFGE